LALERLAEDPPVPLTAKLAKLAAATELAALDERRCAARLESIAGSEGMSAELNERVEEAYALAVRAASDRRFEFEEARDAAARPPDVEEDGGGPPERRVPTTMPWGVQCINELFGFAQGALAQQSMTRRETGLALEGVAAVHAAYFEEMAARQEADPTEADESELSDDDASPTSMDPARRLESIWMVIRL
jgi:hypothetical protein